MSGKYSVALKNSILAAMKANLDGGFLYLFAGTVPETADAQLDMSNVHTQLARMTVGGDGSTGLTFSAPDNGAMQKTPAENWTAITSFDGAQSGQSSLAPTFFRFCSSTDNGRGAANSTTGYRVQGTLSGPGAGGDVVLAAAMLSNNTAQGIGEFYLDVP